MRRDERLIVALDMTSRDEALAIARALEGIPWAFKINHPLALGAGSGIIDELAALGRVICDFKVADIPFTNDLIAREAFRRGATGLIVHSFTGTDSMTACVEAAREAGGDRRVYAVTEMSHPGGVEFTQPNAEALIRVAADCGAHGIIAPATRPERLREIRKLAGDLEILSPGVGAQGGSGREAITAGADRIIVGRAITQADDPAGAARDIVADLP